MKLILCGDNSPVPIIIKSCFPKPLMYLDAEPIFPHLMEIYMPIRDSGLRPAGGCLVD